MKKLIVVSVLSLLLVSPVAAQTGKSEPTTNSGSTGVTSNTPLEREAIKEKVVDKREAIKLNVETKREEVKVNIEAKRDEFKARVEEKRAEVKASMEARKDALRTELKKVKDDRKKDVVLKIDARLEELNGKRLDHFSNVLGKLEDVLERIVLRADKAEQHGLDVAGVRTVISDALKGVETAKLAIQTQTGRIYTVRINEEKNIRADVGKAREALHNDLVKVREAVKTVHDAVRRAAVALAQIPRVDEVENAPSTNSETPSNQ